MKDLKPFSPESIAAALAPVIAAAVAKALEGMRPETRPESQTLTVLEFAEHTGLGVSHVRDLVRAGTVRHVKAGRAGRNLRIPRSEIARYLDTSPIKILPSGISIIV